MDVLGATSPSSRAEWVEMPLVEYAAPALARLRPRGRSGLKFMIHTDILKGFAVSVLAGGVG